MSNLDEEFLKFQAELFEAEMEATKPADDAQHPQQQAGQPGEQKNGLPPPQHPPPALNLPPPHHQQQQQQSPSQGPLAASAPPRLAPPPLARPPQGPSPRGPNLAAPPSGPPMQRPPPQVQLPPPPGGPPMHRFPPPPHGPGGHHNMHQGPPGQLPPPPIMHTSPGGPPMQQGHPPSHMAPQHGGPRPGAVLAGAPVIAAPPQPNSMQFQEPAGPSGLPPTPTMPGFGMPGAPPMGVPPNGASAPPPFLGVPTAAPPIKAPAQAGKKVGVVRKAAGQKWVDTTLTEWPENDFRIFVGNLGNEVSDAVLTAAFQKFPTFQKAKVVRYSHNGKSKGYGFVSFGDTIEGAKVLREMQGKYVGNRPVQLRKSTWDERSVTDKKGRARVREVNIKEPKPKQQKVDNGPPAMFGGGGPFGRGGGPPGRRW